LLEVFQTVVLVFCGVHC